MFGRCRVVVAVFAVLACLAAPVGAATITSVRILGNGQWWTGLDAAIGISDTGGSYNPFYNDPVTDAIVPAAGLPSGTYLAFLGYEDRWRDFQATPATLTLYYSDSTSRSATFLVGSLSIAGDWARLSGDAGLTLGGGGVFRPDRVGYNPFGNIIPVDGYPDVVLQFSDVAGAPVVDSPVAVPEPASLLLLGAGLLGGVRAWRKRRA